MKKTWLVLLGTLLLGAVLVSGCAAQGAKAKVGDTVTVNYTLTLEDGTVYDTSHGGEPLQFTLGKSEVISGFEEAVIGMRAGDSKTVTIPPEKAYGPHRPELVGAISRSKLPEGLEPVVGQELNTTRQDGAPLTVVVVEVNEDTVTLDANPPLAGKTLTFTVQLVALEENPAPTDSAKQAGLSRWWFLAPVGLALAAGVAFFYFRSRRKPVRAGPARKSEKLLTELARLDDDFVGGRIAEAAYRQARRQKKTQLVRLIHRSTKESGH